MTALRGVVMIAAGIAAFLFPTQAVKFVLLAGGGLLLVDGGLGLASMDFAGRRNNSFYLALARNLFCIVAGLTVLASGPLSNVFSLGFLAGFVGLLAVLAGLVEIVSILMDRVRYSSPLTAMLSGALYIVFGLALMFVPLSSATTLMRIATIVIVLYALSLLYRAWRIRTAR
ncbi:cobalt ABC transporter permease [Aquamicrobium sp. LC103]|nr:cobalt ABC transporter permease [Aquamicrobium sp. LC103]